jgi:hypothetical protein
MRSNVFCLKFTITRVGGRKTLLLNVIRPLRGKCICVIGGWAEAFSLKMLSKFGTKLKVLLHLTVNRRVELQRACSVRGSVTCYAVFLFVLRDDCDAVCWMLTYMEHVCDNTIAKAAGSVSKAVLRSSGAAVMPALWPGYCFCLCLQLGLWWRGPLPRTELQHVLTVHEHCSQALRNILAALDKFTGKWIAKICVTFTSTYRQL